MKRVRALWRMLRAAFAWSLVRETDVWLYYENKVTGEHRACYRGAGYAPLDYRFIRPGDWVERANGWQQRDPREV